MDKAARSNLTCKTNAKCDTVNCFVDVFQNGALFPLSMRFDSCKEPRPSVDLTLQELDTKKVSTLPKFPQYINNVFNYMHTFGIA